MLNYWFRNHGFRKNNTKNKKGTGHLLGTEKVRNCLSTTQVRSILFFISPHTQFVSRKQDTKLLIINGDDNTGRIKKYERWRKKNTLQLKLISLVTPMKLQDYNLQSFLVLL